PTTGCKCRPVRPSDPALDGLLNDLFGRLRFWLFVTWRVAAQDVNELVDKSDEQDEEPTAVSELRNPQGHRQHSLSHVVEAPGIEGQQRGVIREERDEETADEQRDNFNNVARAPLQAVDQKSNPDHFTVTKCMCETQK